MSGAETGPPLLPRKAVAGVVLIGVAAGVGLVYVSLRQVGVVRRGVEHIDSGLQVSEAVLELGRSGSTEIWHRCVAIAEEINRGTKLGLLSDADLERVRGLTADGRRPGTPEARRRALERIGKLMEERLAAGPRPRR